MTEANDPQVDWLNTVAHDLKTPINSVRGCIELVQQLGSLNERQQHFADKALNGLQRMEHLVARLLDISWLDAGMALELAECDLAAVIREVVEMLRDSAEQRSIRIHMQLDDHLGLIQADPQRLVQVMDNLISNGIKYNRDGGQVWIQAQRETDRVVVRVRDSGMGISPEDQPRVFERFFRSREGVALKIEGSGLGLAISRAIVHKHGGHIWLESTLGQGTTFSFSLPLEISEGGETMVEAQQSAGEAADSREDYALAVSSEEHDAVDDAIQEQREMSRVEPAGSDEP